MSIDQGLAERVRACLQHRDDVVEKKMFGGLCFMVSAHMACGLAKDGFMVRVEKHLYEKYLQERHAREMDFTGRPLKGMLYIDDAGIAEDQGLDLWISRSLELVGSLPPK